MEARRNVGAGEVIKIDGKDYVFPETAALIYNSWNQIGRPLPATYVFLLLGEQKVQVHVTQIAKTLDQIDISHLRGVKDTMG